MSIQQRQRNGSISTSQPSSSTTQKKRVAMQIAGSTSSILFFAIVLMTNYLGFRHYTRFDFTRQGLFTLSSKSKAVLKELSENIDIYLFMSRNEPNFMDTNELLKRYESASNRVRVHYIDPDREPSEFQVLAQRFGLGTALLQNLEVGVDVAAVITAGDKKWSVKRDDLIEWDFSDDGQNAEKVNVKAEQALTGAIVQITSGRPTQLCLTKGHGEWSIEASDERSLGPLKEALRHDNIEWKTIETLGKKRISKDCDAVFVIGPLHAFSNDESELLAHYLRSGGNLLLALDPIIERDEIKKSGLEEMTRQFGIAIDSTLVLELDTDHLISPNPVEFLVTEFGDHITTRILANRARVLMALTRSVRPLENSDAETLIRSSEQAYAEKEISQVQTESGTPAPDGTDIKGPVSLALAKKVLINDDDTSHVNSKPSGRLIVVGDSDWLRGELLSSPELANFHLASAWTGWLTEREALIAIPPKEAKSGAIMFTQGDLSGLLFRLVILLPGAVFVLGFAVWLNRRS